MGLASMYMQDTRYIHRRNTILESNIKYLAALNQDLQAELDEIKTVSKLRLESKMDREIMRVDISQVKSMWFGGSEKRVKRIFNDYRSFMEECAKIPVLLFNEADAVFSKRMEVNSSNVAQTENTMQNIILEELETFGGIMIATTNLTDNLDAAFERRFLFKIGFARP